MQLSKLRRGETISDEIIEMDDTVLIECTLRNCLLVFRGGETSFSGIRFDNTRCLWLGAYRALISTLLGVGWKPPGPPEPGVTFTSEVPTPSGMPN